jgi:hypothetical protein
MIKPAQVLIIGKKKIAKKNRECRIFLYGAAKVKTLSQHRNIHLFLGIDIETKLRISQLST